MEGLAFMFLSSRLADMVSFFLSFWKFSVFSNKYNLSFSGINKLFSLRDLFSSSISQLFSQNMWEIYTWGISTLLRNWIGFEISKDWKIRSENWIQIPQTTHTYTRTPYMHNCGFCKNSEKKVIFPNLCIQYEYILCFI